PRRVIPLVLDLQDRKRVRKLFRRNRAVRNRPDRQALYPTATAIVMIDCILILDIDHHADKWLPENPTERRIVRNRLCLARPVITRWCSRDDVGIPERG